MVEMMLTCIPDNVADIQISCLNHIIVSSSTFFEEQFEKQHLSIFVYIQCYFYNATEGQGL